MHCRPLPGQPASAVPGPDQIRHPAGDASAGPHDPSRALCFERECTILAALCGIVAVMVAYRGGWCWPRRRSCVPFFVQWLSTRRQWCPGGGRGCALREYWQVTSGDLLFCARGAGECPAAARVPDLLEWTWDAACAMPGWPLSPPGLAAGRRGGMVLVPVPIYPPNG